MAQHLHKDANILPIPCDHPQLMEATKRFFVTANDEFISDKDIAYFAGWLIANLYDDDLLDSLHIGIESHINHLTIPSKKK